MRPTARYLKSTLSPDPAGRVLTVVRHKIQWSSAEFLGWLFEQMNPRQGLKWTLDIQGIVFRLLARSIGPTGDPQLQVHMLSILRAIIAIQGSSFVHPSSPLSERTSPHQSERRPRVWNLPSFIPTLVSGLTQAWMPAIDAEIRVRCSPFIPRRSFILVRSLNTCSGQELGDVG